MQNSLGKILARGRTAEVFAWGESQVLKLYYDWCPEEWPAHEVLVSQRIVSLGIPAPTTAGMVTIDGRKGVIFEKIEGPSLLNWSLQSPFRFFQLGRIMAELQAAMHSQLFPELPSYRTAMAEGIRKHANVLPACKQGALDLLDSLPESDQLCHGDFHPDNVIMAARGPVIIDWMTVKRGYPLADVARTSLLIRIGTRPDSSSLERVITRIVRGTVHASYLSNYFRLTKYNRHMLEDWSFPTAVARTIEDIASEKEDLNREITKIVSRRNIL